MGGTRQQLRLRSRRGAGAEDFDYGSPEYWDERYKEDGEARTYDWLGEYEKFEDYIGNATDGKKDVAVLDLGCGNAAFIERMYDEGYKDITGLDISPVAIDMMQRRNEEKRPEMKFVVGDLFSLPFEDDSFDLIIDKSTMDAVLCDQGKMNEKMVRMVAEVSRVLRTGGTYLVMSAVEIARVGLSMPHVSFDFASEEIPVPFTTLFVHRAVQKLSDTVQPEWSIEEALEEATFRDENQRRRLAQEAAAEKRLKESTTSSFSVLD